VKKTHSALSKKYKRRFGVLHCVKEKPITRQRLLRRLVEKECFIMSIYLNKKKVYTKLQNEKAVLYNYVTNILLDRIYSRKIIKINGKVYLIASKRETNKFLNQNFQEYLNQQVKNRHKANIEILIRSPHEEKALQAVDFVSWAIFRKYEYGDEDYYNLIKSKIIEENPLFP
jgi:predicted transcriptional regulator